MLDELRGGHNHDHPLPWGDKYSKNMIIIAFQIDLWAC